MVSWKRLKRIADRRDEGTGEEIKSSKNLEQLMLSANEV